MAHSFFFCLFFCLFHLLLVFSIFDLCFGLVLHISQLGKFQHISNENLFIKCKHNYLLAQLNKVTSNRQRLNSFAETCSVLYQVPIFVRPRKHAEFRKILIRLQNQLFAFDHGFFIKTRSQQLVLVRNAIHLLLQLIIFN